jgi:hypothetical protein
MHFIEIGNLVIRYEDESLRYGKLGVLRQV